MTKYRQGQPNGYAQVGERIVDTNVKARRRVNEGETRIRRFPEQKRYRWRKKSIVNSILLMTIAGLLSSMQVVAKTKQENKKRETPSPTNSPRISSSIATIIMKESSGVFLTTLPPTRAPQSPRLFLNAAGKDSENTLRPTRNDPQKNEDNFLTVSEKLDIALNRTSKPSLHDSSAPTLLQSSFPTTLPTFQPTIISTLQPSIDSSSIPSYSPSVKPSITHSFQPSLIPSDSPTTVPSHNPTNLPSKSPTTAPSNHPTNAPSNHPTDEPSNIPTNALSNSPSSTPSILPTISHSVEPTIPPSSLHSTSPSLVNSYTPSLSTTTIYPTFDPTKSHKRKSTIAPTSLPTAIPFITTLSNVWNESSALYSGSPTASPTHVPFISSITCQMATENRNNVKQQIYYTYSIETQDESTRANTTYGVLNTNIADPPEDVGVQLSNERAHHQYVISFIEQSLLYNLAKHFLPCTLNHSNDPNRMLSNIDHDRHIPSFISQENGNILADPNAFQPSGRRLDDIELPKDNFKKENNVVLTSINSDPPDHISTTRGCLPSHDSSNTCKFVDGSLTITLNNQYDLAYVESILLVKIKQFMVKLAHTNTVPGLVSASFYDPFSDEALGIKTEEEELAKIRASKRKQLNQILTYSVVILIIFTFAAAAICSQQYQSSSKAAKNAAALEDIDDTPPNTPPLSPEDLDARPTKTRSSYMTRSPKKDLRVKLNTILGNTANMDQHGEEDLSVIMEGSNEDGVSSCVSSSCVSSVFGNFSILSPSVTESERDIDLLDLALAPSGDDKLKEPKYREDQIRDLRNFRTQAVRSSLSLLPEETQDPQQLSPMKNPNQRIARSKGLPLSLHRMNQASQKNANQKKDENREFV